VALLREESYALTNKGEATVQTRFLRLEDNLRFVWKMFVREWDIDPDIDFASDGWKSFCKSVGVRNRITHPRRVEDLSVSDAEIAQVEGQLAFFSEDGPNAPDAYTNPYTYSASTISALFARTFNSTHVFGTSTDPDTNTARADQVRARR
jgi:hypothetical protein